MLLYSVGSAGLVDTLNGQVRSGRIKLEGSSGIIWRLNLRALWRVRRKQSVCLWVKHARFADAFDRKHVGWERSWESHFCSAVFLDSFTSTLSSPFICCKLRSKFFTFHNNQTHPVGIYPNSFPGNRFLGSWKEGNSGLVSFVLIIFWVMSFLM